MPADVETVRKGAVVTDSMDKFHAHLDECKQCREHPFALCSVGGSLLRSTVFDSVVPEPPKGTCVPIDVSKGEWRCRCPPDPEFDTSANPSCFSRCTRCDTSRPTR